jgi:enoyl-CoA hydratase
MDLKEAIPLLTEGDELGYADHTKRQFSDVFKPIIGAVNGYCIAGGLEMLQGTDLRIAAEHATFGLGEVRWGIIPTGGSHIRLPRQIPWAVAMELLLTGEQLDARRAYEIGLVNQVVPKDELMPAAFASHWRRRSAGTGRWRSARPRRSPCARWRRSPASCSRRRSAPA